MWETLSLGSCPGYLVFVWKSWLRVSKTVRAHAHARACVYAYVCVCVIGRTIWRVISLETRVWSLIQVTRDKRFCLVVIGVYGAMCVCVCARMVHAYSNNPRVVRQWFTWWFPRGISCNVAVVLAEVQYPNKWWPNVTWFRLWAIIFFLSDLLEEERKLLLQVLCARY